MQTGPIGQGVSSRGADGGAPGVVGGGAPGVVGVTLNPLTIASVASAVELVPWVVAAYVTANDTR